MIITRGLGGSLVTRGYGGWARAAVAQFHYAFTVLVLLALARYEASVSSAAAALALAAAEADVEVGRPTANVALEPASVMVAPPRPTLVVKHRGRT